MQIPRKGLANHSSADGLIQSAAPGQIAPMSQSNSARIARFKIGDVVRHRIHPFRGVIYDVDPVFNNTEEWLASIPEEIRPHKDQPFYHLLAENERTTYVAYVSEQNLLLDETGKPCRHPMVPELFEGPVSGAYRLKSIRSN